MTFLTFFRRKYARSGSSPRVSWNDSSVAPPVWTPAPEISHEQGKWNEARDDEFQAAEDFCEEYPLDPPRLLSSHVIDEISKKGCKVWNIEPLNTHRFSGNIRSTPEGSFSTVVTRPTCKDVCLLSNVPIIAGLYETSGKNGVYYEVCIQEMNGIIAIGTACKPYPRWRLPGWNRLSAGFHLDDFRKFFEDPNGGRDYTNAINRIQPGDIVGCGYEFQTGTLFYTYNGIRLPPAFAGIYLPHHAQDVFAAIGVEGECEFRVNFGGDLFKWKEGNEWAWRVEAHVGRLVGGSTVLDDELPSYSCHAYP